MFATRLTRLTRALASRHPERAIQRAAAAAPDWSSGTRIGDALKTFNDRHGRRGMARGAVVVILSDGWERGDPALVGREMERLARLAHRIVWVNPRVGASAFSVRAGGMVAALPHCDALVSGHSFEALGRGRGGDRRREARPEAASQAPVAAEPPGARSPGPARRRCPAAPWRCRAATGRAGATTTPGLGADRRVSERSRRSASIPGCERPAVPPHPLGGPQPSFCDLEEHNALTAHQERQRLAARDTMIPTDEEELVVADEAYRAVFLRVHPTGKMVLSLTTESDGKEAEYAQLVADELGVPPLDVKVVPADTDRFGVGHGFNTSPSGGRLGGDRRAPAAKIRDKAQLLAGMALDAPPESSTWSNGAWVGGDGSDPAQVKTIEDIALYAHGTGALPPGVEGGLDAQAVYRD